MKLLSSFIGVSVISCLLKPTFCLNIYFLFASKGTLLFLFIKTFLYLLLNPYQYPPHFFQLPLHFLRPQSFNDFWIHSLVSKVKVFGAISDESDSILVFFLYIFV